ncbi:hypothetical protein P5673_025111 [Acropora cervicornis]|uniref:Uncharacterized protein n=1 Tax=Acropora cervicornis TaxID=6130 RepID=A0AAD9Q2M9_ACRCE|nr:hypothetical protein P5673_025111 [Acropora cervicornis]
MAAFRRSLLVDQVELTLSAEEELPSSLWNSSSRQHGALSGDQLVC